jgi:rhamnosyltransferase
MDQDSSFTPQDCLRLLEAVRELSDDPMVAIVAPTFSQANRAQTCEECDSVITSGSVTRVSAHTQVGGHNEDLFIDDVDHEFGYRLRRRGYRILRVNSAWLSHCVGAPISRKVLWRTVHTTNHSAIRKYYMTRNRLYMRKHFPEFGAPYLRMVILDVLKVVLVEDEKLRKLRFMTKGALDFHRGVLGELR